MTRTTNARVAGFAFLAYIALGIPAMILFGRAAGGEDVAARLAGVAGHAADVRLAALLNLLSAFCALALGVSLYAVTRDVDQDLAMLGLACRVGEGVTGAVAIKRSFSLLWLATAAGADAPDAAGTQALGAFLFKGQGGGISAMFFAVGSTLFAWLLLRGRLIPVALAWLGVVASVLMVVGLPLQMADVLPDAATWFMWIPMAAFEIPLALWLIIRGVAGPRRSGGPDPPVR